MGKDFDGWNDLKKTIQDKMPPPFFCEGEIWWCSIGLNIGTEEDGKNNLYERRVLIVKKFNSQQFLAVPITSQAKAGPDYFPINEDIVILSQARVMNAKRLNRQVKFVNGRVFRQLKVALRRTFQL